METTNGMTACSKGGMGFWQFRSIRRVKVENQSGKDTLHDTVRKSNELVFPEINGSSDVENNSKNTQEKTTDDSETYPTTLRSEPVKSKAGTLAIDFSNEESSVSITGFWKTKLEVIEKSKNKKLRRTYEPRGLDVAPYRKKPKLKDPDILPLDNPKQILTNLIEEKEEEARKKDIKWIAEIETNAENTPPLWVGQNSNLIQIDDETKNLVFATNKHVPASNAVVVEPLKKSLRIVPECEKQGIVVTNDLAIAKMVYQIQSEEKPNFDSIFIALGAFNL